MKRHLTVCIAAALLFLLTACKTASSIGHTEEFNSDQVLVQYDHNPAYTHLGAEFCKAGDIVYFTRSSLLGRRDRYIAYADLESGMSGPLCAKPECDHTNKACNAYVYGSLAEGLSYYDGRIYWTAADPQGFHVFSSAPDGTDRQTDGRSEIWTIQCFPRLLPTAM